MPAAHCGRVMVLVSSVTAPFRASTRPSTVAPVVRRCGQGENRPQKGVGAERRGAADLPEDVAGLGAVDQDDPAVDAVMRVEPAWKTKTASGSPWALSVSAPVSPRGGRVVDARCQRPPPSSPVIEAGGPCAGSLVVGGDEVVLGALVTASPPWFVRSSSAAARRDRGGREGPDIAGERGRAGVGDAGAGQDGEAVCGPEPAGGAAARAPLTSVTSSAAAEAATSEVRETAPRRSGRRAGTVRDMSLGLSTPWPRSGARSGISRSNVAICRADRSTARPRSRPGSLPRVIPRLVLLAGPSGSGKTHLARGVRAPAAGPRRLLQGRLRPGLAPAPDPWHRRLGRPAVVGRRGCAHRPWRPSAGTAPPTCPSTTSRATPGWAPGTSSSAGHPPSSAPASSRPSWSPRPATRAAARRGRRAPVADEELPPPARRDLAEHRKPPLTLVRRGFG